MIDVGPLEPHEILGVDRGANAEEVKDAYRRQSMRHHPDVGGDAWAFRIVAQSYEVMMTGFEVAAIKAARLEPVEAGHIRPGFVDRGVEPSKLVAVEVLWVRYEARDLMSLMAERRAEDRNLSGSIQLTWPDPEAGAAGEAATLAVLTRAVQAAAKRRGIVSSTVDEGPMGLSATLSYASGPVAQKAFHDLHADLKVRGLGVRQWSRDLSVAR